MAIGLHDSIKKRSVTAKNCLMPAGKRNPNASQLQQSQGSWPLRK
jgi:hypothetical protein